MNDKKKELIALEVIRTLYNQFAKFPEDAANNRNAPFHEAFLNAFSDKAQEKVRDVPIFYQPYSWRHGLNTSLEQSFFEKTGQILCDGEKRKFEGIKISRNQQVVIADILSGLKNKVRTPDFEKENAEIFAQRGVEEKDISNFTADVFYEDNQQVVAIELKTVKPNSSVFKAEKTKLLEAKAGLKQLFPNKEILYYIGFPFDPTANEPTGFDKERYHNYSVDFKTYVDIREFMLAGELWDFLAGEPNTMQHILDIINDIATPRFMEKYDFLCDKNNITNHKAEYLAILREWSMFREIKIVENYEELNKIAKNNSTLSRKINQKLFNTKALYNERRVSTILEYIQ